MPSIKRKPQPRVYNDFGAKVSHFVREADGDYLLMVCGKTARGHFFHKEEFAVCAECVRIRGQSWIGKEGSNPQKLGRAGVRQKRFNKSRRSRKRQR